MTASIAEEGLVRGILFAMELWRKPEYQLPFPRQRELSEDWFRDFIRRWSVARTIRADKQEAIRNLLNEQIVNAAWSAEPASAVGRLAEKVAQRRMTAHSTNGRRRVPYHWFPKLRSSTVQGN